MKHIHQNHKNRKKTVWMTLAVVLVIIAAAAGAYLMFGRSDSDMSDTANRGNDTIDYQPPTEEDKAQNEEQKENNVTKEEAEKNPSPQPQQPQGSAAVTIVDAAQYDAVVEVRGYVSNVYEDGGTCTAEFTKGPLKTSGSSTAFKDATTTQCGALDTPRSAFAEPGEWNVTVKYASPSMSGSSAARKVTIR